ncbi:MAG: phospholipase D-like domain-containing protein [Methanoregulaceae archaeon]|nr:phospholipase D-like domain-containing protein [Methanoregulaceae archaeon]
MRLPLLFLCFFLLLPAASGVSFVAFCPDPYMPEDPDEYIILDGVGPLDGITVSDGEGGFRFPEGTQISGNLTIARSGDAFRQSHGRYPDYEWYDTTPAVPDVIRGGTFRLANGEDQIQLLSGSRLLQEIAWPEDVKPREGQIHYLESGVWDPRVLLIGQSTFEVTSFDNISGVAFVSPDCAYEVFTRVIDESDTRLLVNVYEFTHPGMAESLVRAHDRGVSVHVLLEGGPVGGISPEEKAVCWEMNQSGIPVYQMTTTGSAHAPYRFDHAKYVISDDRGVLITSENFKESGFPTTGYSGNRGWGVYLENEPLARYFTRVFEYDAGGSWVTPVPGNKDSAYELPGTRYRAVYSPLPFTGARVTPVISPDTSRLVIRLIDSSRKTVDIEEAYISNASAHDLNPYLAAAVNASRRGVKVRVLLDSYWFNVEGETDNDEMVDCINRIARSESLPLEARCAGLGPGRPDKVHNKGVIVDGEHVLISSINWNTNSPTFNREAGVIIDHPAVAGYYSRVFEDDWHVSGPGAQTEAVDLIKIGLAIAVITLLVLYSAYRRKRLN